RQLLDIVFPGHRAGAGRHRHQPGWRPFARYPESAQRNIGAAMSEYATFSGRAESSASSAARGSGPAQVVGGDHGAAGLSPSDLLLDLCGLRTWFHTRDGVVKAVDGVSLQV